MRCISTLTIAILCVHVAVARSAETISYGCTHVQEMLCPFSLMPMAPVVINGQPQPAFLVRCPAPG